MLFALPFTTYDQVRELGYSVGLYCQRCYRRVRIDLDDPRLRARSFAGGVRFVCANARRRWTASPPEPCGTLAQVTIYPPADRCVSPGDHGVLYCSIACGACQPSWMIDQARRDDPIWAPLNDKRFKGYRCPTCRRALWPGWHGHDTRPHHLQLESWRA